MSLKTSNKAAKAPKLKTITVHAILTTNEFQRAKCCADDLFKAHPSVFNKPAINGMFEFQWSIFLNRKKQVRCRFRIKLHELKIAKTSDLYSIQFNYVVIK